MRPDPLVGMAPPQASDELPPSTSLIRPNVLCGSVLMAAVARTPNKRFVLTTREYILAQAKKEHEHLSRSHIDLFRFVVECEDYTELDKARILANHLYFAKVPQAHIAALVAGGFSIL